MCRLCDSIAPICAWKARKSFESYCAAWECDEAIDEEIDVESKLGSSSPDLSLRLADSEDGAAKPPICKAKQTAPEAGPAAAPSRLVILRSGTIPPNPQIRPEIVL